MKSSYPFGSCPNLELCHHHRILKTHIRHYDVICSYIETRIRPYDVTLIYAAYVKCGKIHMAYAAYAKIQNTNDFFKEKVRKYK